MKDLWRLYRRAYQDKYLKYSLIAILFMLFDVGISLIIPYISGKIVKVGIVEKRIGYVNKMGLVLVGISLLGVLLIIINNISAQYLSQRITEDIRNDLFEKVQELSFSNVDEITTGRLITIITNDTMQIQQYLTMSFRIILRAPLLLVGSIVMAYITSPNMFVVVLVMIPLLVIGMFIVLKFAYPYFIMMQEKVDNLNTQLLSTVEGAREIKTFVSQDSEKEHFDTVNEEYHQTIVRTGKLVSLLNPIIVLLSNAAIGAIIYIGGYIAYHNLGSEAAEVSGDLMTYISYIMNIVFALFMLSMITMFIIRAGVSAKRINGVLNTEIDIKNNENPITDFELKGEIEFVDVSFTYGKNSDNDDVGYVLSDINLVIPAGSTIGVIGSTGSGKTAFVQMIPRLYDATSGQVLIDGIDVKDLDLEELRSQVSFVTQQAIIFEGTIKSNILQGKVDAEDEELKRAAEFAVADEYINRFEDGFDTYVTQEGSSLSGGQKQRLSLARAFVREPKILILDDSTSAVDAKSEALIKENIRKLPYKMTTIIVAQKISSIEDCDKIIVLGNNGKVDGYAPHDELLLSSKVYQEIYESQYGGETDA